MGMRHQAIDSGLFVENRERLKKLLLPNSLAVVNANDIGTREGISHACFALALWLIVGRVSLWMRREVDRGHEALMDAQRAAIDRSRAETLRQTEEAEEREAALQERIEIAG